LTAAGDALAERIMGQTLGETWARIHLLEVGLCRRAVRAQARRGWLRLFRAVSWLGDGPLWYALAFALPLALGSAALPTVARLAAVGVAAAVVAKGLKVATGRPRPYLAHPGIVAGSAPLDRWSFPSGHTLHAVAFTVVIVVDLPAMAALLVPFSLAVAASRVVLGLHYPTDVVAGGLAGAALAAAALSFL
jgi:undecaprenyl-diphosphatase